MQHDFHIAPRGEDRMGYAVLLSGTAAIVLAVLLIAAGAGLYLFRQSNLVEKTRFFAARNRRLAFVERASLDNGRKLLLVRRDNVEHLVMIGGPIDLVIETGIRSQAILQSSSKENSFSDEGHFSPQEVIWPSNAPSLSTDKPAAEPKSPLSSAIERVKEAIKEEKERPAAKEVKAETAAPEKEKAAAL
jgi:flagellar protein FliO/FliZ